MGKQRLGKSMPPPEAKGRDGSMERTMKVKIPVVYRGFATCQALCPGPYLFSLSLNPLMQVVWW